VSDLAHVLSWPQDEAELVTELQSGSESAFDWLVTHYHGPVFGLIAGLVGDATEAADITQEVFLKAFRGLGNFRHGSSLRTWLYRIAVREALNARRWWWRHHRYQTSLEVEREDGAHTIEIEDPAESPLDLAESSETREMVWSGLHQVPEVFRGAVILRDLEGLSYEEVAEVLDVSVGTVKSRILRGRQALREILAPLVERQQRAVASHAVQTSRAERRPQVTGAAVALGRNFGAMRSAHSGTRSFVRASRSAKVVGEVVGELDRVAWRRSSRSVPSAGGGR
jgi:RNA polymerase sigma-70 factor (ECF subfamily)